ncbi:MAG: RNA polymerase sigma factor [Sphingomonas sp.]|uniref:RNA polymerase sigma factor n=1 Tax=Sphingomonas sp. TaxID=28214 RepID=UPI001ACD8458|nr:RNA polymerase sigma factor [Sphingomonas sp.]MBN8816235.1 RNA polymerase sigma factor [Sphingomonas sp.]
MTGAYAEFREELRRFLIARLGDAAEADDALQELWIRANAGDSGPIANPRAYLYRAAQNLALDVVRSRTSRQRRDREWADSLRDRAFIEPVDLSPNAEAAMLAREDAAALASAIAALPEKAGQVFRLHKIDGLSHADIAARLGISRSGVEKHIAVAMAHLRRAMAD